MLLRALQRFLRPYRRDVALVVVLQFVQTIAALSLPTATPASRTTKLVREVRAELKRLGLPPLGRTVPKGAPMSKKRRQAEAALHRLGKGPNATGSKPGKTKARRPAASSTAPAPATCPRCFVSLPATGLCDDCS